MAVGGTLTFFEAVGRCWCRGAIGVWGSSSAAVAAGGFWLASCSCLGVLLGTALVVVLCWPGWLGGVEKGLCCMRLGPSVSGGWSGSSLGGGLGPICLPSRSWAASGVSSGPPWLGGFDCVGVLGDPAWLRWLWRSWPSSTTWLVGAGGCCCRLVVGWLGCFRVRAFWACGWRCLWLADWGVVAVRGFVRGACPAAALRRWVVVFGDAWQCGSPPAVFGSIGGSG